MLAEFREQRDFLKKGFPRLRADFEGFLDPCGRSESSPFLGLKRYTWQREAQLSCRGETISLEVFVLNAVPSIRDAEIDIRVSTPDGLEISACLPSMRTIQKDGPASFVHLGERLAEIAWMIEHSHSSPNS